MVMRHYDNKEPWETMLIMTQVAIILFGSGVHGFRLRADLVLSADLVVKKLNLRCQHTETISLL